MSVRIGFRIGLWFVPVNAGIFVIRLRPEDEPKLAAAVENLRQVLEMTGNGQLAARLVYEVR